MHNVCHHCGFYRADKLIDPTGPFAVCPECGYRHPFLHLPLLVVGGASGTGKSTVLHHILAQPDIPLRKQVVLLESDILWRPEFNQPETSYRDFFETWLRMCKNIAQSGRPALVFGAGFGVPVNLEPCVERRYFTRIHYLALVATEETIRLRLESRPAWRMSSSPEFIARQVEFNQWFLDSPRQPGPPVTLVDTTRIPVEQAAAAVAGWASAVLKT